MVDNLTNIGLRFKQYVEDKNLTDTEVGYHINTSAASVGNIKNGKNFNVKTLLSIFEAYPDLDHTWLLFGPTGRANAPKEVSKNAPLPLDLLEKMNKLQSQIDDIKKKLSD